MYDLLVTVSIPVRAAEPFPTTEEVLAALRDRMDIWPHEMSDLEDAIEVLECEEAHD